MSRSVIVSIIALVLSSSSLPAQQPAKDVAVTLGVQRAIASARESLRKNQPAEAISALEAELLNADGDAKYLALLHDAYWAQVQFLQAKKADEATLQAVRRKMKALEGPAASESASASLGPAPGASPADVRPPAPPIPEAPSEVTPPRPPTGRVRPASGDAPPLPPVPTDTEDPSQQTSRDEGASSDTLVHASEAFASKRYPQAATMFAEASRRKETLSPAQKDEWAYCRLHAVAVRLNKGNPSASDAAALAKEVDEAVRSGSERLVPFGNQLRAEIGRRGVTVLTSAVPTGWETTETPSFRVIYQGIRDVAAEVAATAEAARRAMYERWVGPPASSWTPKCDIYLHASGAAYAKVTGKPPERNGHSTVAFKAAQVVSRRIDLRADEPTLLDGSLPNEVTQVLLAELFAEQPLPRWAVVGMAALSESPESVARYRRAVPELLREKKLFAVGPFMERADFGEPTSMTSFYAESVSLVAYLVELKGPKPFATFLREAPRRGYAKALTTYYGFKDPADLQDRWVKHTLGGE
jgi:hypothetical protein